jgi:hypothetical protein
MTSTNTDADTKGNAERLKRRADNRRQHRMTTLAKWLDWPIKSARESGMSDDQIIDEFATVLRQCLES